MMLCISVEHGDVEATSPNPIAMFKSISSMVFGAPAPTGSMGWGFDGHPSDGTPNPCEAWPSKGQLLCMGAPTRALLAMQPPTIRPTVEGRGPHSRAPVRSSCASGASLRDARDARSGAIESPLLQWATS